MKVLCEEPFGDFVDSKSDEEGGKDVDRIVYMAEQDDNPEKERRCQEYPAQNLFIPKNEGHEERKPGMSGKEEIPRECEGVDDEVRAVQGDLVHGGRQMGKDDKKRADDKEQAEAFEHKRDSPGAEGKQAYHKKEKHNNAINENTIDVDRGQMIENKVIDRVAYMGGRITAGQEIDHKADCQETDTPKNGDEEFFAGPVVPMYNQFHIRVWF